MFLFYHHAIMIAENGFKSKENRLVPCVTSPLDDTYNTQRG